MSIIIFIIKEPNKKSISSIIYKSRTINKIIRSKIIIRNRRIQGIFTFISKVIIIWFIKINTFKRNSSNRIMLTNSNNKFIIDIISIVSKYSTTTPSPIGYNFFLSSLFLIISNNPILICKKNKFIRTSNMTNN